MDLKNIVSVTINRLTSFATVRNLNNIAIMAKHTVFTAPEVYREYTDIDAVADDGFLTSSYVYDAVNKAFNQNPRPQKVIVGVVGASQAYADAIADLRAATDQWLWVITDDRTIASQLDTAEYIQATEKFYCIGSADEDVIDNASTTDIAALLKSNSYDRSFVFYHTTADDEAVEAALLGRCTNGVAGSVLFLYKTLVGVTADSFTDTEYTTLETKNITAYSLIEDQGSVIGSGKVGSGEWIHVMLASQWIITRMREALWNYLRSNEITSFTNDSLTAIQGVMTQVLTEARNNRLIANDTPFTITVPNALDYTSAQRATGVVSGVKFKARLAGAIVKIDGVVGEVYL